MKDLDSIKNGEEAMDAWIKETSMEHIGNYLGKYRKMIAEYDEAKAMSDAIDALETVVRQQGKEITEAVELCHRAVKRLTELEKEFDDYQRTLE